MKNKDVLVFVDRQSALYALKSTSSVNGDLVPQCKTTIHHLQAVGTTVKFMRIPSHTGISQ